MGASSPQLPEVSELGGTENFGSVPKASLPGLGRGIPNQLRAVSPMTQASDDLRVQDVESNDTSTASSKSSDSDSSFRDGSDASNSDGGALSDTSTSDGGALSDASTPDSGAQTPTAVRTAARQLGTHMSRPGDGEEIREARTRAQTRVLNREAAAGLVSEIGPCERGRVFQAPMAATETGREKTKLPGCFVKAAEPEPTSYINRRAFVQAFGRLDGRDEVGV